MDDRRVVTIQLGREPRSTVDVVARCHLDLPVVIAVPPHLDDGTPFPTRYWLTCPLAVRRIGTAEASGGVKAMEARIDGDPAFARRHRAAVAEYTAERAALVEPGAYQYDPSGGVGGAESGVKCLHAHYAHFASGADNPVGEATAPEVEPLNCAVGCVTVVHGQAVRNPQWREPPR